MQDVPHGGATRGTLVAGGYPAGAAPANGRSIGKRYNVADAAPSPNPEGRLTAGALPRCGLLVENDYTSQPAPCTASQSTARVYTEYLSTSGYMPWPATCFRSGRCCSHPRRSVNSPEQHHQVTAIAERNQLAGVCIENGIHFTYHPLG